MAYDLNGSSQDIRYTLAANQTTLNTATYGFWAWADTYATNYKKWLYQGTAGDREIAIEMDSGYGTPTGLVFVAKWSSTPGVWSVNAPATGAWHHVIVTYDWGSTANNPIVYVDGVSVTVTKRLTPAGTKDNNGTSFMFGSEIGSLWFNGKLAEGFLYNRVITAAEAAGIGTDGFSPLFYPRGLVFYDKMIRNVGDLMMGTAATLTGSPSVYEHPRVIYPSNYNISHIGGSTVYSSSVSPVSLTISNPTTTATYIQVGTASASPIALTATVPTITATYVQTATASVSPVSLTATIPAVTASYTQVGTALVSPVSFTASVASVTASYVQVGTASVDAVAATLTVPSVTASANDTASVAPVTTTLTLPAVTASYIQTESASVAPVSLTVSVATVTAINRATASSTPVVLTATVPSVAATYVQVGTVSVSPVSLTLAQPSTTATYIQTETASVAPVELSLTLPAVTATGDDQASVSPVVFVVSAPAVTASYVQLESATVIPASLLLTVPAVAGVYVQVQTASVSPVSLLLSVVSITSTFQEKTARQTWASKVVERDTWRLPRRFRAP